MSLIASMFLLCCIFNNSSPDKALLLAASAACVWGSFQFAIMFLLKKLDKATWFHPHPFNFWIEILSITCTKLNMAVIICNYQCAVITLCTSWLEYFPYAIGSGINCNGGFFGKSFWEESCKAEINTISYFLSMCQFLNKKAHWETTMTLALDYKRCCGMYARY